MTGNLHGQFEMMQTKLAMRFHMIPQPWCMFELLPTTNFHTDMSHGFCHSSLFRLPFMNLLQVSLHVTVNSKILITAFYRAFKQLALMLESMAIQVVLPSETRLTVLNWTNKRPLQMKQVGNWEHSNRCTNPQAKIQPFYYTTSNLKTVRVGGFTWWSFSGGPPPWY